MSLILLTGIATLDIAHTVTHYPQEDEKLRALQQWRSLGGNAANTARVLAKLRHRCDWLGVLASDSEGQFIAEQLKQAGVNTEWAQVVQGVSPVSYITINQQNASRTIINYRDLPELSVQAFSQVSVERYDWLHFEGRNNPVLPEILELAREAVLDQPISLEVEKNHPVLQQAIPLADVVMFSKAYAQSQGYEDAMSFLHAMHTQYPELWMTCTWGEWGAWAINQEGTLFHAQEKVDTVVDTLGAGDVFNAGLINGLATGNTLQEALQMAVQLASRKVQQIGLEHL